MPADALPDDLRPGPPGPVFLDLPLQIRVGETYEFPDGLFRFCQQRPNGILLFQREGTALDKPITIGMFSELLDRAEVRRIDFFPSRRHVAKDSEFGPHEEDTPDCARARTLQFYVRMWDKQKGAQLGTKWLKSFIARLRTHAIAKGLDHDFSASTLFRAIKECGAPDCRPLRAFRSSRGRGPRSRLAPRILELIARTVEEYWSDRTCDYNDAYGVFRQLLREENARRQAEGREPLKGPRRMETIRRRITAATSHENWARKYSKKEADEKFKGCRQGVSAERPLQLAIMDSTTADTWTVIDTETFIPLGRPTITVCIDVYTRMILGHLVSFEPPSLFSALLVLKRVNRPKAYIRKVFSHIQGTSDAWGCPEAILVDHGLEFTSPSFQDALADAGIEVIWAPVKTPQYKAIGERFFGTLNTMLLHKLQGGVPYDPKTMRQVGLDPKADAIITLGDLDALLHEMIILYQGKPHEGLGAVPARVWREGIERHGRRFIADIRQLDAMIGRVDEAVLTRRGIRFKRMVFHDTDLTTRLLADMAPGESKRTQSRRLLSSARVKVKIKYNPADCSSIQVWNHAGKPTPHYVSLPNRARKFSQGLSFWQAAQIFAVNAEKNLQDEDEMWAARDRLRQRWMSIAGQLPLRETRDARRGLAQSMGTYGEADTLPEEPIRHKNVLHGTIHPDGRIEHDPALIPMKVPAFDRTDDGERPAGERPSRKALKKAAETRKRKKEEAAEEKRQHDAERTRKARNPSKIKIPKIDPGKSGGTSFAEKLLGDLDWDEDK